MERAAGVPAHCPGRGAEEAGLPPLLREGGEPVLPHIQSRTPVCRAEEALGIYVLVKSLKVNIVFCVVWQVGVRVETSLILSLEIVFSTLGHFAFPER